MNILAIDTSASACSLSLLVAEPGQPDRFHDFHQVAPMRQSVLILPAIDTLLKEANLSLAELDALAFSSGPGSYTGIRMASSVVKALALAHHLPIIPVSSLAAIAETASLTHGVKQVIVVGDARMNEVYWAAYALNESGLMQVVMPDSVCLPKEVRFPSNMTENQALFEKEWCGVGDGWAKYRQELTSQFEGHLKQVLPDQLATAHAVAMLAKEDWLNKKTHSARDANPIYLK